MKDVLKRQDGAVAILEAAFIYPVVIMIIALLVYLGMYILQASFLNMRAQQLANIASRCLAYPGYEKLGPNLEGNDYTQIPDQSAIQSAVADYSLLKDAYRYWKFGTNNLQSDIREQLAQEYVSVVEQGSFLQTDISCEITSANYIVTQYVIVHITGKPQYPQFLDYFGVGNVLSFDISVRAVAPDNAEFIRNSDMVIDFSEYLLEKFHLDGKFAEYMSRIKSFVNDLMN